MSRRQQKLFLVESPDEGLEILPFAFQINGTTTPDNLSGDTLASVAYNEAGEILCTLRDRVPVCFAGFASVSATADDVDIYGRVDWSSVVSDGTFVVRFMTGATQTDPTDDLLAGGFLLVKKTTRAARG